jgi:threonine dehydrogenase-like Zn-dependent dehydrogenase
MKAVCWFGKNDVRVREVPDPRIETPTDALIRVRATAICGSDLHLFGGYVPTMKKGDILGHEFIGDVIERGSDVRNVRVGDRVVVPFAIACGRCAFCRRQLTSLCENTNPSRLARKLFGYPTSGLYGYSHMYGGYAGGQAELVRVVHADVNAFKVPDDIDDEHALFLTDVLPTGYMAADNCAIEPGQTVAVWGCGPVGLFAMKSARLLGAERVIAIDRFPERLALARKFANAVTIDYTKTNVFEEIRMLTGGRGPHACIDAVGMESHGRTADAIYDRVKFTLKMQTDRPHALRQAIRCCGKGGHLSIAGVYAGFLDKFPLGVAFGKGLTFKMGQTHVHRYVQPLMERIQKREIDPTAIITHRAELDDAPELYRMFREKKDNCVKVVLRPTPVPSRVPAMAAKTRRRPSA